MMRANISWAFAGNAVYAGCQWLVFVLIVRALDLGRAGQFAYWMAVTGPVFVFANVRLRNLVVTADDSLFDFSDYLNARLLTTAAAIGVVALIGTWLSTDRHALAIVSLVTFGRACDAISEICHGLFQRELDMRTAGLGLMINGILSAALVGASLWMWPSLAGAAGMYAAASMVTLIGWDLPQMRKTLRIRGRSTTRTGGLPAAVKVIWRALPLGLSAAIGSLQINLPRYTIAVYVGPAALAIFSALAYMPTLGNLIANAIAQAALPVLARDLRVSRVAYVTRLRALVRSGVALGAVSVLTAALMGRALVTLIYSAAIASHVDVLIGLMIATALTYSYLFLGSALTARLRFSTQCFISSAGLLTVGSSVIPLVSRFGLRGAAYALCAGAVVEGSAYVAVTVHDLKTQAGSRSKTPGRMDECTGEAA
jgi:O-antigen/teichoic acid export membrane protein